MWDFLFYFFFLGGGMRCKEPQRGKLQRKTPVFPAAPPQNEPNWLKKNINIGLSAPSSLPGVPVGAMSWSVLGWGGGTGWAGLYSDFGPRLPTGDFHSTGCSHTHTHTRKHTHTHIYSRRSPQNPTGFISQQRKMRGPHHLWKYNILDYLCLQIFWFEVRTAFSCFPFPFFFPHLILLDLKSARHSSLLPWVSHCTFPYLIF